MPSSDNYEGTPPEFENGGALNDSNYLNRQAQILGISVEELESEIIKGKTFEELAEEKGISLLLLRECREVERIYQMRMKKWNPLKKNLLKFLLILLLCNFFIYDSKTFNIKLFLWE